PTRDHRPRGRIKVDGWQRNVLRLVLAEHDLDRLGPWHDGRDWRHFAAPARLAIARCFLLSFCPTRYHVPCTARYRRPQIAIRLRSTCFPRNSRFLTGKAFTSASSHMSR